jgi:hypothetical protein
VHGGSVEKEGLKMGYQIKKLELSEAQREIVKYDYALIYLMSDRLLLPVSALPELAWDECIDARFFSDDGELHIFEDDGQLSAVQVSDAGEEDTVVQKYELSKHFSNLGNTLLVQEYLEADEDGQMQVKLTRLKGIA